MLEKSYYYTYRTILNKSSWEDYYKKISDPFFSFSSFGWNECCYPGRPSVLYYLIISLYLNQNMHALFLQKKSIKKSNLFEIRFGLHLWTLKTILRLWFAVSRPLALQCFQQVKAWIAYIQIVCLIRNKIQATVGASAHQRPKRWL